jgi:hypothetical protein
MSAKANRQVPGFNDRFDIFYNHESLIFEANIRPQMGRLCKAPWKEAKHQIFLRQVSPFGPLAGS